MPFLSGKASFGLFAKYRDDAANKWGPTEFDLTLGNVNFAGTGYQSLTRDGAKVMLQGTGRLNGSGDYAFSAAAIDGSLPGGGGADKLRVRVWERASGKMVYDNLGPPPPISKGEIQIK
jgi:hypothetical protein